VQPLSVDPFDLALRSFPECDRLTLVVTDNVQISTQAARFFQELQLGKSARRVLRRMSRPYALLVEGDAEGRFVYADPDGLDATNVNRLVLGDAHSVHGPWLQTIEPLRWPSSEPKARRNAALSAAEAATRWLLDRTALEREMLVVRHGCVAIYAAVMELWKARHGRAERAQAQAVAGTNAATKWRRILRCCSEAFRALHSFFGAHKVDARNNP